MRCCQTCFLLHTKNFDNSFFSDAQCLCLRKMHHPISSQRAVWKWGQNCAMVVLPWSQNDFSGSTKLLSHSTYLPFCLSGSCTNCIRCWSPAFQHLLFLLSYKDYAAGLQHSSHIFSAIFQGELCYWVTHILLLSFRNSISCWVTEFICLFCLPGKTDQTAELGMFCADVNTAWKVWIIPSRICTHLHENECARDWLPRQSLQIPWPLSCCKQETRYELSLTTAPNDQNTQRVKCFLNPL